jgi:hypothetical protein
MEEIQAVGVSPMNTVTPIDDTTHCNDEIPINHVLPPLTKSQRKRARITEEDVANHSQLKRKENNKKRVNN